MEVSRTRRDRCPGVQRPWPADDGLLVRLRLVGGVVTTAQLLALVGVAETFGDGHVHVTGRTNLQVRAMPGADGALTPQALAAVAGTGLLPWPTHELVRNVMVSPCTGVPEAPGRADLRPVAAGLDRLTVADPRTVDLPARFLTVLDDGRGDLLDRPCDLGLVALDATTAQVRVGDGWGPVVPLAQAPRVLVDLALRFLAVRGTGATVPWHVRELPASVTLVPPAEPDARVPAPSGPLPFGEVPGGRHVPVPATGLDRAGVEALTAGADHVVVTPWRGVFTPAGRAR